MLRTIEYSQLDPETKTYLRKVRAANGRGAPGIFRAASDGLGGWAVFFGILILPVCLWIGYSTNKAPWANAMIQTAGVLLGGWLIFYAIRRWTANPDRYAGKFFYFDPQHVFVGKGEQLQYARLDSETGVEPLGVASVRFANEDRFFDIVVPNKQFAGEVADFYGAVDHLLEDDQGRWSHLNTAELGAVARYLLVEERVPLGMNEVNLDIEDAPEEIRPSRNRPTGLFRYAAILLIGAALFVGFWFSNAPLQEMTTWGDVKRDNPSDLRNYLINENVKEHREEATKILAALYDKPIAQVQAQGSDKELREAFAKLLDSLRGPETPAVSLKVNESNGVAGSTWGDSLQMRLADGIGTAVGKDYVVFVRKPDDKPALMTLEYSALGESVLWTLELRLKPDDAEPYFKGKRTTSLVGAIPGVIALTQTEAIYQDLMGRMIGQAPAAPPPLPDNDW